MSLHRGNRTPSEFVETYNSYFEQYELLKSHVAKQQNILAALKHKQKIALRKIDETRVLHKNIIEGDTKKAKQLSDEIASFEEQSAKKTMLQSQIQQLLEKITTKNPGIFQNLHIKKRSNEIPVNFASKLSVYKQVPSEIGPELQQKFNSLRVK